MNNINNLKPHQSCGVFFEKRFLKEIQKIHQAAFSSKGTQYEYVTDIICQAVAPYRDQAYPVFSEDRTIFSFYEIKSHKAFHSHSAIDVISKIMKSGIERTVKSENFQGLLHQLTTTATLFPRIPTFAIIGCYTKESNQLYNDWLRDEDKAWASYTNYVMIRCIDGVWETFTMRPEQFWNRFSHGFTHSMPRWMTEGCTPKCVSLIEFLESLSLPVNIEAYEEFIEVLDRQRRGATWINESKPHELTVEDQPELDVKTEVEAEELDDMKKYNLPSLIAGADMTLKDFKKIQEVLEQGGSLSEASDAIKKSSGYLHGILHHRLDNKGKYTEFKTWINSMLVIAETESEDDMITARQNDLILSQQAELSQLKEEAARQNDLILSQQAELSQLKQEVEAPSADQAPPSPRFSSARFESDVAAKWKQRYDRLMEKYQALKEEVQATGANQVNTQIDKLEKELEDIYKTKIDKLEKELDTWAALVDDLHERLDRHHKLIDHFLG
jgi:hypothetical protein